MNGVDQEIRCAECNKLLGYCSNGNYMPYMICPECYDEHEQEEETK